jgi:AcrR family transcriptional regulator
LSEAQIVEAAVRLAGSVRLENVSMRALADELGVPVMTIYNYVSSKDSLYELVMDSALARVRVPSADDGTWEERLKQLEREARAALAHLPGVTIDRRDSPEGRRLAEGVLSILASAGFDDQQAALAFATLFTFMIGQIDIDIDVAEASASAAVAAVQSTAEVTQLSRDEIFEFGFDAVIEGLKARLPRA